MNSELAQYLPTFFLIIPLFLTFFLYLIGMKLFKSKWKSIHVTVQWTAIFYIIAVTILVKKLFNYYVIGGVLILLISMLAIILIYQWKTKTEVVLKDGIKIVLRISFLFFGLLYIVFVLMVVLQNM